MRNEWEIPPPLHYVSDEPTMVGDELGTTANAGTALRTIPIETNYTGMKYTRLRTLQGANLGRGMRRSDGPMAVPWSA